MGSNNALFVTERYFLAWILLTGSGGFSSSAQAPSWDQQNTEVREGDDLSLSCRVEGLEHLDVVRVAHRQNTQLMTIADNSDVKYPFNKLLRYKVHYELEGSIGTVHMHYRGIQGSDSGSLECYKLSDEQNMAVVNVQVLVPIEELYVISISESGRERRIDDRTADVTLQDGGIVGVGCVASVNGSLTVPGLEIAIGDEDRSDLVDKKNVTAYSSDGDLTVYYTEQKRMMMFERVDPAHSRKLLTCTAKVKGYEEKIRTVLLKVRYAPIVACAETNYYLRVGVSVTLSCNVKSNPNSKVKWQIGDSGQPENTVVKEKVLDEDLVQVNMTISELTSSHFTTYTFTASNDIGITTEMIIVEEDRTVDDDDSVMESFTETEEVAVKKHIETEFIAPVAEDVKPEDDNIQETENNIREPENNIREPENNIREPENNIREPETPEEVLVNHQKNSETVVGPNQSYSLVDSSSAVVIRLTFPGALVLPIIAKWL